MNIDPLSLKSYKIILKSETDIEIAIGTGFFYQYDEKIFFVTNWHNVSGKHPDTKENLSSTCAIPHKISICTRRLEDEKLYPEKFDIDLYDSEQNAKWLIHPIHGELVDVIALELEVDKIEHIKRNKIDVSLIAEEWMHNPIVKVNHVPQPKISDDVFILGFPIGLDSGAYLPLWKKGSIASEPSINQTSLPRILIDTATRRGMSGAPVFFRRHDYQHTEGTWSTSYGTIRCFLGIYSGRIDKTDELSAQLGIVWKKSVINEIIEGNQKDTLII